MDSVSLFIIHLRGFVKRHGITDDLPSRCRKLKGEVNELDEAILDGDKKEIAKEAADVAIIAFHIMLIVGVMPLWTMYLKLQEVASRPHYKERAEQLTKTPATAMFDGKLRKVESR